MNANKTSNQISKDLVKNILQEMFQEQKLLHKFKVYKKTITKIISSNTTKIKQILD